MRHRFGVLLLVGAVGLSLSLALPAVEAKPLKCSADMMPVGTTCVNTYEASVWDIPAAQTSLIKKVRDGKATFADLTAGGATQVSPSDSRSPAFPGTFPNTGNWTAPLYAASIPGVPPTACVSWFQAEQACRPSGKRLLANEEWQAAAAGTVDPGSNDGLANAMCNTSAAGPRATGNAGATPGGADSCISNWGVQDMVGNVWERVGDWVPPASGSCGSALFSGDFNCLAEDTQAAGTGALIRGGNFNNGTNAGAFAVNGNNTPSNANNNIGFRAAH